MKTSPIGSNFNNIRDWTTDYAFTNLFLFSREWISGDKDNWDNGQSLNLDALGYITSLLPGQIARTLLFGADQPYQIGKYNLLYDGTGTIEYSDNIEVVSSSPGQDVILFNGGKVIFNFTDIDPTNYIRNIRCFKDGIRNQQQLFNPLFLNRSKAYACYRYVHWMGTDDDSNIINWSDRTTLHDARWSTAKGAPYEVMVNLSNKTKIDPWFCIPHLASDDFILSFAKFLFVNVDPTLTIRIEYSNEVFNLDYSQAKWAQEQGKLLDSDPLTGQMKFYSHNAVNAFNIFRKVFGTSSKRVSYVMGSWADMPDLSEIVLSYNDAYKYVNDLAIAPYFGGDLDYSSPTGSLDDLYIDLSTIYMPAAIQNMKDHKVIADKYKVNLIAYEGGQHLVDKSDKQDPITDQLFDQMNRDKRMFDLYTQYFTAWKSVGGKLFCHHVNCDNYSKVGKWGALENLDEPRKLAPKFDAIQTFIEKNPKWW